MTVANPSTPDRSDWRTLAQPQFLVTALILLAGAISFNSAVEFLKWHFRKEPVPLRRALDMLPAHLGPWVQISKDQPLDKEMQDVLGTEQYIFRDYIDTRRCSMDRLTELGAFQDKSARELAGIAAQIAADDPYAVIRCAVTYYTGLVDTVAHIPDRCYVADGYEPTAYTTPTWNIGRAGTGPHGDGTINVRFINFDDATPERASVTRNVAYFFHCNGSFESDPLSGVRFRLQDLSERKAYYAKVELMDSSPAGDRIAGADVQQRDRDRAAATMTDFLSFSMPEVLKCLPDWDAVSAAK